jgi:hypothetical protein
VEDNTPFALSQVTDVERLLHETSSLVSWNILRLIQVNLEKRGKFACVPLTSFKFPYFLLSLFL